MDEVTVLCHSGYSVDSDPNGESSFVGICGADGEMTGMGKCKPVSCGVPKAELGAESKNPETFFGEHAVWNCLPGFSTDGLKGGDAAFSRACLDHGDFGQSSPDKCADIDFCVGNPCTSNGVCTDAGVGKLDPGYSCECAEGYEIKKKPDGSDTCTEDDCHGEPCGIGGTCTDLSKLSKIEGAYTCECELGYILHGPDNAPTCIRNKCGNMPTAIKHIMMDSGLPKVELTTWNDKPSDKDKGVPIMKSGDSVKYTCATGYSTDGTYTKESLDFTLRCELSGLFSRAITGDTECSLIKCDNWQKPRVPYSNLQNDHENYYEYGDVLVFKCFDGYTTTGEVGGSPSFNVDCTETGVFSEVHHSCLPVSCNVPEKANSHASTGYDPIKFGIMVTYTCSDGFVAVGTKDASFDGTCGADGTLKFEGAKGCMPRRCGTPEVQPNADLIWWKKPFPEGKVLKTTDAPVSVVCHKGYTLGGSASGAIEYSIECQKSGKLVAMIGNSKVYQKCDAPKFQVSGYVTDAQSANIFLSDAEVKFTDGDKVIATATTNFLGKYSALMPAGTWTITVSKTDYISYEAEIIVISAIAAGGAGDAALSKVLAEGEWRVTLTWAAHSEDLDSHTYLGKNSKQLVYWQDREETDASTQMSAVLDRDDVNGFGPETTTFKGIGTCTMKEHCLVKFLVDNYTPKDKDIGESEAIITLYQGSRTVKKYNLPTEAGDARIWPIFTLDSAKDAHQVLYDGDQIYGPALAPMSDANRDNWGGSLDGPACVDLGPKQLLVGFKASSFNGLNRIQEASFAEVEDTEGMTCQEVDWFESDSQFTGDGGFSSCPAGYYLAGICRDGSRLDGVRGPKQIIKGKCCKPDEVAEDWGVCHETPLFKDVGWSECGTSDVGLQTVMVGLQMKYGDLPDDESLKALATAKCCELVGGGLMPNPHPIGSDDGGDYGDGGWGWDGDGGDWDWW